MRMDSEGLFWQDFVEQEFDAAGNPIKKPRAARMMPDIPDTGWKTPTDFPNLSSARALAVDVETKDPQLKTHGPGWARNSGHIVGISLGVPGGGRWYFPIRHTIEPETNMDPDTVLRWAKDMLGTDIPKIGANIIYDAGWLKHEGIDLNGIWYDVQNAEALINSETPKVALDELAKKYLNESKQTDDLYPWSWQFYGGSENDQRKNIWKCPPRLVGPYAEADADLPIRIIEKQWKEMSRFGLLPLFEIESKLTKILMKMRLRGVAVNLPGAEDLQRELDLQQKKLQIELDILAGEPVNVNAAASIAKVFDKFGEWYPRTDPTANGKGGNPSFTATFLESCGTEIGQLILRIRQIAKLKGTFIESYIINNSIDGLIYGQFHQLKGQGNGARSGRLSSSTPNLQNIPSRTEEGRLIRSAFISRVPNGRWIRFDYSQIEYRLLAHHAVGDRSDEVRAMYVADPTTDFHEATRQLILRLTGIELERKQTKTINFGLTYGMSKPELRKRLNLAEGPAEKLFTSYHGAVPFAKATLNHYRRIAENSGLITTILGRRSLFPLWGPRKYDANSRQIPLEKEKAYKVYGHDIIRAYGHKALNRVLQGGAADIIKKALVDCDEAGYFDAVGYPVLTVHDELDFDDEDPVKNEPIFKEIRHVMETCVPLRVPLMVDMDIGVNWGATT